MNYHIMTLGATTIDFIEDVYEINEQSNNEFIILDFGQKINFKRPVIFKTPEKTISFLKNIIPNDKIYVHYYHSFIGKEMLNSSNKLYVFQWGGDFFEDPIDYHKNRLYDKLTLKLYNKLQTPYHLVRNPINFIKLYFRNLKINKKAIIDFKERSRYIERIDYVINSKENSGDIAKTVEIYPNFKAEHLAGSYNASFEFLEYSKNTINGGCINVLLGNSASYANNHFDAFEILKKYKKHNLKIYTPLTYGNERYKKEVIKKGKEIFKEKFIPLEKHMDKKDYINLLKTMNIGLFFHKRSQAFGNIILLLSLGIPVFMNEENTLKKYFENIFIKTYYIKELSSVNLSDVINENNNRIVKTIKTIKKNISKDRRLEELNFLLTN